MRKICDRNAKENADVKGFPTPIKDDSSREVGGCFSIPVGNRYA